MLADRTERRPSWTAGVIWLAIALAAWSALAPIAAQAQTGTATAKSAAPDSTDSDATDSASTDSDATAADVAASDRAAGPADQDEASEGPTAPATPSEEAAANAQDAAAAAASKAQGSRVLMMVAIVVAVFVIPVVLGHYLSKALRMPDYATRISVVLFATLASLVATLYGWPPKLGIDLSGGVILIYEVEQENFKEMDKLVGAISKRVNPGGIKEVTVRPYGEREIEIQIPRADQDELDRMQTIVSQTGSLEFRIVADRRFSGDKQYIEAANDPEFKGAKEIAIEEDEDDAAANGDAGEAENPAKKVVAKWVPVVPAEAGSFGSNPNYVTRLNKRGDGVEVLVLIDRYNVTGDFLTNASAGVDRVGKPCVNFVFNSKGASRFGKLTSNNLPDPSQPDLARGLAIILDGDLYSAPAIRSRIDDRGEITGSFTQKEVEDLASVLTAGSLPTALRKEPTSSMLTGPSLGQDTINRGVNSMLVSTIAVVLFMVLYYRFAGIVANLALLLNVLLIVAFMILFNAAFTLSGLAGLALTVGMAVDANVLIYERMREEIARGATLRMAIRNGFDRATTTIIDANVTTLISAIVLYAIGTDQVKGFAVTLILGIVMNLFTAITFSRLIFEIAERRRWISQLRMLKVLDHPNFDFIGKRKIAYTLSVLLIAAGLAAVVERGKGLLDIDFTGGVSVETLFDKKMDIGELREKVGELPDVTVQEVRIAGEEPYRRFLIITSKSDIDEANPPAKGPKTNIEWVEDELKRVFKGELTFNRLSFEKIEPVAAAATSQEKPAGETPPAEQEPKAEPDKNDGAARFEPDELLLALADGDEASPRQDAAPAGEKPAAQDSIGEGSADEKPADQTATADNAPGDEKTAQDEAGDGLGAGETKVELAFTQGISHDALVRKIQRAAASIKSLGEDVVFSVDTPAYEPGSKKGFETWTLQIAASPEDTKALLNEVEVALADEPFFPSSNKVGASVAGNTKLQATYALLASLVMIIVYVWIRFQQVSFGLSSVLALVHDVLVALGALAISYWLARLPFMSALLVEPFKINLPIIAAFLTIIGYSINDTIVIFDRIREIRGKSHEITPELVNLCVNQTLSRTLLTSLTVFIVVLILYIFGGQGVHGFAFTLVIGTISGTYSTVYIATPLLIWMNQSKAEAKKGPPPGPAKRLEPV
ncbi:MAG TPA: protein translocase subunit SecD [Pirellulales bacterium]|nr:protein translocase subunit SecD [Pirellulales bacterium]